MNDAMSAAAQAVISCTGLNADSWKNTVHKAWQPAVQETVDEYIKDARRSFEKGQYLEGAETVVKMVDFGRKTAVSHS